MKKLPSNKTIQFTIAIVLAILTPVPIYDSCMSSCGPDADMCAAVCIRGFRFKSLLSCIWDFIIGLAVNDVAVSVGDLIVVLIGTVIYGFLLYKLIRRLVNTDKA